jgi:hypothetical protein
MADLAALDSFTAAEEGMPFLIINPRTGSVLRNDDKSPMMIYLLGRHGEVFRETLRRIQLRRTQLAARRENIDADMREQEDTETLVACTRNWTIQSLDKNPFPATADNIRKLWTDNRFRALRETAMNFILTDVNFLAPSSEGSDDLLAPNSSSLAPFPARTPEPSAMSSATTG